MITRKMEEKCEELQNYFNKNLSSQEKSSMCSFNALINNLRAEITKEIKNEVLKQYVKLESLNKMLQQQVSELHNLNLDKQAYNEELEQYRRCL